MIFFQDQLEEFRDAGARILGISVDSPFVLQKFRESEGFDFPLVSDTSAESVRAYGIETDLEDIGLHGVAKRSVFVVDSGGEITYSWKAEDSTEKCHDEVLQVLRHVRENY
ncbi:MAG: redoxin domain-containing protein [Candidatus Nanohaloarchaea archaeon]